MSDLISRKALVKALLAERENFPPMVAERYSFGVKMPHRFNQAMRGGIRKALRAVETAPAVDAEPVRHGKWIYWDDGLTYWWECSICSDCESKKSPYCPNCGAKIDEEV